MRKWLVILVLVLLLPAGAMADDCFDFSAWREAVVKGDESAAAAAIQAGRIACGCTEATHTCLALPGFSRPVSPADLEEITARLFAWRKGLPDRCRSTDTDPGARREQEQKCYKRLSLAFHEGLLGEEYGRLFAPMALEVSRDLLTGETSGATPPPGGIEPRVKKTYRREVRMIGEQICRLEVRLHENKGKLERVKRRGNQNVAAKRQREAELIKLVKELSDLVLRLRHEFRQKTGESFNAYDFCGPDAIH